MGSDLYCEINKMFSIIPMFHIFTLQKHEGALCFITTTL